MSALQIVKNKAEQVFLQNLQSCGGVIGGINLVINELAFLIAKDSKISTCDVANAYLNYFVEKADVALVWIDKDLRIIEASELAKAWLKKFYSHKFDQNVPIKGKYVHSLYDDKILFMRQAYKKVASGKVWRKKLLKWPLNDRRYRWLNMEILPWFDKKGLIASFLMYFEDVTKHHELELSNKRLQESNDLLESFNLVFSHDLIQPLRQIANFSEILKLRFRDYRLEDSSIEKSFSGMSRSIEHVRSLSEGIALYCKKGELSIASEKICVKNLLENILDSSLEKAIDRFQLHIEDGLNIFANATTVTQLFQNLFANAVKYSDADSPITLSAASEGNYIKFYLHNYGYCDKKLRSRNVFNTFESSKVDGAGIGLMICKKVVEAYSGKIILRSWKKRGTLVTFTLPVFAEDNSNREKQKAS
jgi:signal transduction histidine kinase